MKLPEPQSKTFSTLVGEIENGQIKIPQFQREFVLAKFQAINHDLETTMKTHLIENLDTFGIWNDDYEQFLSERAKVVSREISKRIIKQEIDKKGQSNLVDDFEEELTTIE